jgi:aminoglycoside phosphotransferase (APT) family kinase protein
MKKLTGGNSNDVYQDGSSVIRRTSGPFVHHLLRHLTAQGFTESPVLLEANDQQERLTFLEGEVGNDPLKPYMQSNEILVEAARLLRRFHDITQQMVIPPDSVFQLPVQTEHEVICHNDFAPYNLVFRDQHLVGIIDFDLAGPGTRLWDIAYAVYRFAPLSHDVHCRDLGWEPIPDKVRRLSLFCDAYGLQNREALIPTVIKRLEFLVQYMQNTGSNLDHLPVYLQDLAYIRQTFTADHPSL